MPTIRQKKAFKEVLSGSTISKAMIKAGYSATTASTTGKLTNTKGWEKLLKKHLPDSSLAKKHRELLNKREKIVVSDGRDGSHIEDTGQPHSDVAKALDMAYKLNHRFSDGTYNDNRQVIINISDEKSRRILDRTTPPVSEG